MRAGVLALLAEQPCNGYQIMQELARRSRGAWRPSPGAVYPAIQQLQDEGLVRPELTSSKRAFHLTDEGRAYVERHRDELGAPWDWASNAAEDARIEMAAHLRDIGAAVAQAAETGTAAQLAAARDILLEARRALDQILSRDEPHGDAHGDE